MSASAISTSKQVDTTRLGSFAATQPVSGITKVDETFAVHGLGRGGFVRMEKTGKDAQSQ